MWKAAAIYNGLGGLIDWFSVSSSSSSCAAHLHLIELLQHTRMERKTGTVVRCKCTARSARLTLLMCLHCADFTDAAPLSLSVSAGWRSGEHSRWVVLTAAEHQANPYALHCFLQQGKLKHIGSSYGWECACFPSLLIPVPHYSWFLYFCASSSSFKLLIIQFCWMPSQDIQNNSSCALHAFLGKDTQNARHKSSIEYITYTSENTKVACIWFDKKKVGQELNEQNVCIWMHSIHSNVLPK